MGGRDVIAERYRLEHEIGRGGMGAVWLGVDTVLGREVALKQLALVEAGGPTAARAAREARLAARLSHPNVVAVFDLVEDGSRPWLVMEYVEGTTLSGLVADKGPLSPEGAANILGKVAAALLAAHQAGVVHRDVKPSNILLSDIGQVKLTDFGIARSTDSDQTLTQTGLVTGSPAYLSPEVASGQPATPASDVWSLGATLYFALTGRQPYEVGENVLGTLYRIVNDDPPRTERAGRLAPVLAGAMTRDPARRWTMAQVYEGLTASSSATAPAAQVTQAMPPLSLGTTTATLAGPTTPPPSPTPRIAPEPRHGRPRSRRGLLVGLSVVLLAAVTVLMFLLGSRSGDEDPSAATGGPTTAGREPSGPASSASPSPSEPESSATDDGPTDQGVRGFVTTYLQTAASDPESAFGMLTPEFQAASGGLDGYLGFWDGVNNLKSIDWIEPQVNGDLGVSYRYTYVYQGLGFKTQTIHLKLVYQDGRYLVAGE